MDVSSCEILRSQASPGGTETQAGTLPWRPGRQRLGGCAAGAGGTRTPSTQRAGGDRPDSPEHCGAGLRDAGTSLHGSSSRQSQAGEAWGSADVPLSLGFPWGLAVCSGVC